MQQQKIWCLFGIYSHLHVAIRHANPTAMGHLPQAQLSFVLIPQFAGNYFLKEKALFRGNDGAKSKDFPSTQITCICCLRDQSRVQTNWEYSL
jgi:hypothetical protein